MAPQDQNLKTLMPIAQNRRPGPYTVEAPGYEPTKGETVPRRNIKTKDALVTRVAPEISTIFDLVGYASKNYGNAKALGTRKVIKVHTEIKKVKKLVDGKEQLVDKKWTYQELSEYSYITYTDYEKIVWNFGAGLRKLGMTPRESRLHIFAATHAQWLASAHGAASQSIPIVTAYDSLGEEGLKHSMLQTHSNAIFLDPSLLPKLVSPLKEAKDLAHVIYNSDAEVKQADIDALKAAHPHVTVHSFKEVCKLGEDNWVSATPPTPDDLCCIMYTSGSTGNPKGVMLKHKNVCAAIAGVNVIIRPYLGPGDGLLTYLPLAHILEFVFENAAFHWGCTMGYGSPRTLSDGAVRNCKGDIREFKPTILVGVPAVWETVKKGIMARVAGGSAIVRNLFWGAMAAKGFLLSAGLPGAGILDAIVFNKIKDATGGRLRLCMCGGGPISKETQRFISLAITPMIIGYGLTETSALGALMDPLAWDDSCLGEIPGSIEVKLVDFPDAGYFSTSNPPQGEIWIRGANVADGYLDLEEETKEAFEDGWFKTGDIGEWTPRGELRLIDRKKNLVKTLNGEYIALEKLESVYRSATVVSNICVYAAGDKTKPVAIIVPAEAALKTLARENGIEGDSLEELVGKQSVISLVTQQLQTQGRKGGLQGIEIIDGVALADEEWTPQNGLVTSATKLNRKAILAKYKKEVEQAYKNAAS